MTTSTAIPGVAISAAVISRAWAEIELRLLCLDNDLAAAEPHEVFGLARQREALDLVRDRIATGAADPDRITPAIAAEIAALAEASLGG